MLGEKHGPLGHGQTTASLAESSLVIDVPFPMRLPVGVRATIHWIREDGMDGGVSRNHPTNVAFHVCASGEGKILGTEPEPDLASRSQFGELRKDCADRVDDGFIGMKTNLAVFFSPNEAHGQASAQFPACSFIANSTVEPCTKNMKFCFRHDAL